MDKSISACFTKNTDDWRTPSNLYNKFMSLGFYDPCPYQSATNLFGKDIKDRRVYINPPFSQNKLWIKYAIDLSKNNDVWLLIAVRSDTIYFRQLIESCSPFIFFIQGRMAFNDKGYAPFPVCLIHLNSDFKSYGVYTLDEFINLLDEIY